VPSLNTWIRKAGSTTRCEVFTRTQSTLHSDNSFFPPVLLHLYFPVPSPTWPSQCFTTNLRYHTPPVSHPLLSYPLHSLLTSLYYCLAKSEQRWGDAPVHSIGAALFLPRSNIHFWDEIGYEHNPYTHCPKLGNNWENGRCSCDPKRNFGEFDSLISLSPPSSYHGGRMRNKWVVCGGQDGRTFIWRRNFPKL
jgi:hypothetical protein